MPAKPTYPLRDYAVGHTLLTLRSRAKLTQAAWASQIGIHRRSVQKWENGESYPTAENLQALITVLIAQQLLTPGQERAEATELWQQVSQAAPQPLPLFDTTWFDQVLAAQTNHGTSNQPLAAPASAVQQPAGGAGRLFAAPATSLIGRSAELHAIASRLADPACRLLTLLGPGGIGKTRLALATLSAQKNNFRDGVLSVPLSALSAPQQLVTAIGDVCQLSFGGQAEPAAQLLAYFAPRHSLLLLDDFEHLLEGADLIGTLLQAAPQLKLLVTSRARLNLQAEWLFDVEGLAYPASDGLDLATLTDYSAVQLFIQRATQVQPDFRLTPAALPLIARICQHVAGLPLAIELAAASVRSLSIAEIERQIGSNLDLLATDLRDVPIRHRSMRAVFDHSWHLLSAAERVLLRRLAVFRGSWEERAVKAICAEVTKQLAEAPQAQPATAIAAYLFSPVELALLVNKSLVRRHALKQQNADDSTTDEPRFSLLEPIREYALEELIASGEAAVLRRAHALYCLRLAEATAAEWDSPAADANIERLDLVHDNLRAALQWACDGGDWVIGLQLAGALRRFWRRRGYSREGRIWLEELLKRAEMAQPAAEQPMVAQLARLRALQGAAWLASDQHDYARATQLFEQSRALSQALGVTEGATNLLVNGAVQARAVGQYQRATALLEDAIAQQRALGDRGSLSSAGLGLSLFLLGLLQREQGDFVQATSAFEECIELHRAIGDREGVGLGLLGLSDIARDQGNSVQALAFGTESLHILRKLGVQWAVGFALNNLALGAYQTGDLAQALIYVRESIALFRAQKAEGSLAEVLITLGQIVGAQGHLAEAYTALTEALHIARAIGPRLLVATILETAAGLTLQAGGGATLALPLFAAATALRVRMGTPRRPAEQSASMTLVATLRSAVDPARFTDLWSAAEAQSLDQILEQWPDATLFSGKPAPGADTPLPPPDGRAHDDWGLAMDVPLLYGRADELATLTQWVITDQCRVITLVGIGGIGKTSLAITFARQMAPYFATVVFRSLSEAPPFAELLDQLIHRVAIRPVDVQTTLPHLADKLALLVDLLRQERCLLILDNLETILQAGTMDMHYLAGYEGYGLLLKALSGTAHQSCLLLTSRERPPELAALEGARTPVRSLRLTGLSEEACRTLLADQELIGTMGDAAALARRYDGNPLAIKLVVDPIRSLFSGDIAAFLNEGYLFFDGVGQLLTQQISRASALEQALLTWLAIGREPVALEQLMVDLAGTLVEQPAAGGSPLRLSRPLVLTALQALWRRNLIERGQTNLTFTLQPVVLEYLTQHLIERMVDELLQGRFGYLCRYALMQATAKDYVRRSQEVLLVAPLLQQLLPTYGDADALAEQILDRLATLRTQPIAEQGYGPGNLLNLLHALRGHLRGLDLSRLAIRQVYLKGVALQDSTLADAAIQDTVFTDNFDAMTAVAISPTGAYWAAISRRGRIRLWAAERGSREMAGPSALHQIWLAHKALAWTLAFSPDGRILASGSWDGSVKLWNVATGVLLWTGQHSSHVNRVAFAPDGRLLASCGQDATVRLWDVQSGQARQVLAHAQPVTVVAWRPFADTPAHLLACGDLAGAIHLWVVAQEQAATCVQTLVDHTTWVDGLAFAPDGRALASASYDGSVKLWSISTRAGAVAYAAHLYETLTVHMARVHRVAWSPDGRVLATCSFDRTVWLWDVEQRTYRTPLQGHTAGVYDLAFTPDSSSLLSGSEDGTLRIWEVATGQCAHVMKGYTRALYDVDWSPDGTQVVTVGTDTVVMTYPLSIGREASAQPTLYPGPTNTAFGVGWSPNGRWLASSELDNVIRVWEIASGNCQILQHPEDTANLFFGVAWSPDGLRVACGTAKHGVLLWNVPANRPEWRGPLLSTKIRYVAWRPDGAFVAGGGEDGTVYVWDATTGTLRQRLTDHDKMITGLAWSPDGAYLAASGSGSEDGTLLVWAMPHGQRVDALGPHPGLVSAVAWSLVDAPAADLLISGGADGKLRWWNIHTGACVQTRSAHEGAIYALRCSPDGRRLASCGDDGVIMLWDLESGEPLQTIRRDRPYERLNISGLTGITPAQRAALIALGALEQPGRRVVGGE